MAQQSISDEGPRQPLLYQIRIRGHLTPRWQSRFEKATITLEDNGNTLLTCPVVDQAELYGLLRKVRDLGVPLLSVIRIKPSWSPDHPNTIQ